MRFLRSGVLPLTALVVTLAVSACSDSVTAPGADTLWVIEVSGEQFRVRVSDVAARIAIAKRLENRETGVIIGTLVRGNGGFNGPWSWHLDPATVQVPDMAIELCDGRPSMVEADLGYWADTVHAFCPWGARVVRREP